MNKENCGGKKEERRVKRTKNKDGGKNLDRQISAVTPQAQMQQHVQATRDPSTGKHSPHSIKIWYKHNETEDQEGTRRSKEQRWSHQEQGRIQALWGLELDILWGLL